jgi:DnaD/phage-associated family protein
LLLKYIKANENLFIYFNIKYDTLQEKGEFYVEGWIKLHRKLLENPIIMKDSDYLSVWIYLLLNATHTEYDTLFQGKRITLQKGQLITGRKSIAEKLKIDENKVQRILKLLENEQQIEQQKSNKNRLITIVSWNKYQQNEQQIEQQVNNNRTTNEQQMNTNKNIENNKNIKNEIEVTEITKCYEENIGTFTPATAEKLFDYLNDMDYTLIIQAIKQATLNGVRKPNYIFGILNSWTNKGYKVLADIQDEQKEMKKTQKRQETEEEKLERWRKEWGIEDDT